MNLIKQKLTQPKAPVVADNTGNTIVTAKLACSVLFNKLLLGVVVFLVLGTGQSWGQCVAPSIQASNINATLITNTSMQVNWTNGNGSKRLLKMMKYPFYTFPPFTNPSDGTDYLGIGNAYTSGEQIMYVGTGSSFTITNLERGMYYWFRVYEYNCLAPNSKYNTDTAANNPRAFTTTCPPPSVNPLLTSTLLQNICSGTPSGIIYLNCPEPYTRYEWNRYTLPISGIPVSLAVLNPGNIPSYTITNLSQDNVSIIFDIRAYYNSCFVATFPPQSQPTIILRPDSFNVSITAGSNNQTVAIDQPIISINYSTPYGNPSYFNFYGLPSGVTANFVNYRLWTISGTPTQLGVFNYSGIFNNNCGRDTVYGTITVTTALPVTISSLKAAQQGNNIAVEWKASNQLNMKQYEVEKSTDAVNFIKVNTQAATGTNGSDVVYHWVDVNPVVGTNYYRIRSIGFAGDNKFSQVVVVKTGKGSPDITIYPNPVVNNVFSLQFSDMKKGVYQLRMFTSVGQLVFTKAINHNGGNASQTVPLIAGMANGNYRLEITKPDQSKINKSILIVE